MQAAISERQFMMYLQPKYSIAKNEIIGAEALVRWRHPERGMISQTSLFQLLRKTGLSGKLIITYGLRHAVLLGNVKMRGL